MVTQGDGFHVGVHLNDFHERLVELAADLVVRDAVQLGGSAHQSGGLLVLSLELVGRLFGLGEFVRGLVLFAPYALLFALQ